MSLPDDPPNFNNLDNFEPDKLPAVLEQAASGIIVDGLYKIADRKGYSTLSEVLYEEAYQREEMDVQEQYEKFSQSNTRTVVSSMERK